MKEYTAFALVFPLVFSAFSQTINDTQRKSDSLLEQLQVDINKTLESSQMFKWEGDERPIVTGFLKEIFTDSTIKHRYAEVNPAIAKMYIMDQIVVFDSCTYQKWIESIPVITDFDTYEFLYKAPSDMPAGQTSIESIFLFNKKTRKNERIISINYIDECLVSIRDSERSLFVKEVYYTHITKAENDLLDKYGIDYTGGLVRYYVQTGLINKWLSNPKISEDDYLNTISAYEKFIKWNKNYFKILPDEKDIMGTIENYFSEEDLNTGELPIFYILNESRKIVGYFSQKVNDQNADIDTIYLFEIYNSGITPVLISHLIFIKKFNGESYIFTSDSGFEFTE